jgi:hypothetical protein
MIPIHIVELNYKIYTKPSTAHFLTFHFDYWGIKCNIELQLFNYSTINTDTHV